MVYSNGLFTWLMNGLFAWLIWMFIRMVIDGLMVYWTEWFIDMLFDSK